MKVTTETINRFPRLANLMTKRQDLVDMIHGRRTLELDLLMAEQVLKVIDFVPDPLDTLFTTLVEAVSGSDGNTYQAALSIAWPADYTWPMTDAELELRLIAAAHRVLNLREVKAK